MKLSKKNKTLVREQKKAAFVSPELATLVDEPFSDKDWIYEKKLDGIRCIVVKEKNSVSLYSRNRKKMNATYSELVDALKKQKCKRFVIDGEIVAFKKGLSSFSELQKRINIQDVEKAKKTGLKVYFFAFDMIYIDGLDIRKLPLVERKKILKGALSFNRTIRYLPHRQKEGLKYFKEASKKGWEGLIAKKASSPYQMRRTRNWLKFKCINQQEFVIAGYTQPQGSRIEFGALLIGYYTKGGLHYAGKVGTGYDTAFLKKLGPRLKRMERKKCPFTGSTPKGGHWVEPKLVAEIGFTEWTRDGKLRHPRFLGLRTDKSAKQVRRR